MLKNSRGRTGFDVGAET